MRLGDEFVIIITGRVGDVLSSENVRPVVGPMLSKLLVGKEVPDCVWRCSGITVTEAPAPPPKREFAWAPKLP